MGKNILFVSPNHLEEAVNTPTHDLFGHLQYSGKYHPICCNVLEAIDSLERVKPDYALVDPCCPISSEDLPKIKNRVEPYFFARVFPGGVPHINLSGLLAVSPIRNANPNARIMIYTFYNFKRTDLSPEARETLEAIKELGIALEDIIPQAIHPEEVVAKLDRLSANAMKQ